MATDRDEQREVIYLETAELFADLSTCLRGNVGCVIVKENRIISTGYNGAPPGMVHCTEVGCLPYTASPPPGKYNVQMTEEIARDLVGRDAKMHHRAEQALLLQVGKDLDQGPSSVELEGCARTVHAEANAAAFAVRSGVSVAGAAVFCTHSPCRSCALILASAGIVKFVFSKR